MAVVYKSPYEEYYSIDIIEHQRRGIPCSAYHDQFKGLRGKMRLDIEAISKVFVGTGGYELDKQNHIYQPFARIGVPPDWRLVIPGTTIKGVVRTYAEALSPSCEGGKYGDKVCGECICCSIFGALGFQGRVTFCDTEPIDHESVNPKICEISVRWSGGFKKGRRFYYHKKPNSPKLINKKTQQPFPDERVEVVPEKTHFTSDFFFENLSKAEMGLLILAMGLSPTHLFNLKLGGGKNRLLGSVRFNLPSGIQLIKDSTYVSFADAYDTEQLDIWGKEVAKIYLDSLTDNQRRLALESIKAFQSDP